MNNFQRIIKRFVLGTLVLVPFMGYPDVPEQMVKDWLHRANGFEANQGQISDFKGNPVSEVLFRANLPGYSIFITERGISYVIYSPENDDAFQTFNTQFENSRPSNEFIHYARIDLELLNSHIDRDNIEFSDELPGYTNYYLPNCSDGVLFVKSYRRIRIKDIYPGIDWVFRYQNGKLHHEFEVEPTADVNNIKFNVRWAEIKIKEDGKKLVFSTPLGIIEDGRIYAYEEGNNNYPDISYKIVQDNLISFDVKNYSGKGKLIIDPPLALLWATYYGGSGNDELYSIITDSSGNIFISGWTQSTNLPVMDPGGGAYFQGTYSSADDGFILKFNKNGVRQWATYYGGSRSESCRSLTLDDSGNIFVTGWTWSSNLPLYNPGGGAYFQATNAGYCDVFILKFNNAGVRQWATYYGGSGYDYGYSITADRSGNILIEGHTESNNFPLYNPGGGIYFQDTYAGGYDLLILKFSNTGVRQWATYYGGSGYDYNRSIKADNLNNIFVTGYTNSSDFPVLNPGGGVYFQGTNAGGDDAFILKFINGGVRQWATYYGGAGDDYGCSVTNNKTGDIFVVGYTSSAYFPIYNPGGGAYFQGTNAGNRDAFILKFNNTGMRQWATYYGGAGNDYGYSVATDKTGTIFMVGNTSSGYFPLYNPGGGAYFQETFAGIMDAFILKFSSTGAREWATYYGGSKQDYGYSVTTDISGNILVAGETASGNFPLYNPGGGAYFQGTNAGSSDAYILKFETSVGVNEIDKSEIKNIFFWTPTFFKNELPLKISGCTKKPVKIVLYNLSGSKVLETVFPSSTSPVIKNIKTKQLPSGIYFLEVHYGKKNIGYTKVIKLM